MVVDWATKAIQNNSLVLDIESTGFASYDELIEIAVVDLTTLEILYQSLFKPTVLIHPKAQEVHGITYEMLKSAPFLEHHSEELNLIIQNKTIITYNASFDHRLFRQSYDKYNLEIPTCAWDCLMLKSNVHFSQSLKLDDVCSRFGVEKGTHRAASDALAAAKIIHKLAEL